MTIEIRRRIIDSHEYESRFPDEELELFRKELSLTENSLKSQIELALIQFLHEQKDFLPQNMYLPNIQNRVSK
ncbi:hypothetical protein ADEAN_000332700 [Angomonas deanei]|uniref:Uncharacterized protein n=1 Tax=Angomonas deanei TaxID=59799 RepID=A0A7G2C8F9_9TRYP|nr:hypothetical protein ADEAN_000332700 [Angomonas deanei]